MGPGGVGVKILRGNSWALIPNPLEFFRSDCNFGQGGSCPQILEVGLTHINHWASALARTLAPGGVAVKICRGNS